jgi:hypothetical protein
MLLAAAKQSRPVKRRPRQTEAGIPLPRIDQRTVGARPRRDRDR